MVGTARCGTATVQSMRGLAFVGTDKQQLTLTHATPLLPADPMVKPIDQYVFAARVSVLLRGLGKVPWPAGCPLLQIDLAVLTCVVFSPALVNYRQKGLGLNLVMSDLWKGEAEAFLKRQGETY